MICRTPNASGGVIEQFLQRAKRTEPAAVGAPPPEQQRHGGGTPQNEDEWLKKELLPAKAVENRIGERQDIDDGQLRLGVEAEPEHAKEQETDTKPSEPELDVEPASPERRISR